MSTVLKQSNFLLAALPATEREDVFERCETIEIAFGTVIVEPGQKIRHVYFPQSGFVSLLATVDGNTSLEVGLIGREGMFGIPLALGVSVSPLRATVQGAGTAMRMSADDFRIVLKASPGLQRILNLYLHVLISQLAQVAVCTCFHVAEARLARWMLMAHDRAQSNTFTLTHELLSEMLGVRRAGVSTAAASLQESGFIRYNRGVINVVNRAGLEDASCECYVASENMYNSTLKI